METARVWDKEGLGESSERMALDLRQQQTCERQCIKPGGRCDRDAKASRFGANNRLVEECAVMCDKRLSLRRKRKGAPDRSSIATAQRELGDDTGKFSNADRQRVPGNNRATSTSFRSNDPRVRSTIELCKIPDTWRPAHDRPLFIEPHQSVGLGVVEEERRISGPEL